MSWIKLILVVFTLCPVVVTGQVITTIVGNGVGANLGQDSGVATSASIFLPDGGAIDQSGNYFFSVSVGEKILELTTSGILVTIAGNGSAGFSSDSTLAKDAELDGVETLRLDSIGNIFFVEGTSRRIRKIDIGTGLLSTVAGNGSTGFSGDSGLATNAAIGPRDICFDKSGNLYIADQYNNRVRKVNASGIITTFAGTGSLGIGGIGGPATSAQIQPTALCSDIFGNIFIADNQPGQTRVCKVDTQGIITIVAGNPISNVYNGDDIVATDAHISPISIAKDKYGNLFIADVNNNRIRQVDVSGIIHTVVGSGVEGFGGDSGDPVSAKLYWPGSITLDSCGNLYIADTYNYRIRKVTYPTCSYLAVKNIDNQQTQVNIYPNPATSEVHLDNLAAATKYALFNVLGIIEQSGTLKKGNNSIGIQALPAGIYLLELIDDEGRRTVRKMIKE